jgi:hypothetical protein
LSGAVRLDYRYNRLTAGPKRHRIRQEDVPVTRESRTIRVRKLSDQGKEPDYRNLTPGERIELVWQLTLDAWAMKGEPIAEQRLLRHVVRVVRGKR